MPTHPDIAARLVGPLVHNLGVDGDDHHDRHPLASVQHALTALLVLNLGDVAGEVEAAGRSACDEVRQRLFDVFGKTARLLDPKDRWREPGDPHPTDPRRRALFAQLVGISLTRIGGDWGERTRYSAANRIEYLEAVDGLSQVRALSDWAATRSIAQGSSPRAATTITSGCPSAPRS